VPDGALSLVNIAALPSGDSGYVIESSPVIHILSAERDLVPGNEPRPSTPTGLLALGGPAYDTAAVLASRDVLGSKSDPQLVSAKAYRGVRPSCTYFPTIRFEPLPGATQEVKQIADLWRRFARSGPESNNVTELSGAVASEAAFKSLAPGHRVLHLATHGFFLEGHCVSFLGSARGIGALSEVAAVSSPPTESTSDSPLQLAGLALAGANRRSGAGPTEEDGILTAEEIAALDLTGVEWAVLSACNTGVGQVQVGEGVSGLRRAFEAAGVGTLVMSLWSVEDDATQEWMRALYEARLVEGLDTAQSAWEASLRVLQGRRRQHQSTHPFYWGAFVAAGGWR
jgi:CHAT domain-containing protein